LRLARDGFESIDDARKNINRIDPWLNDIELHRFNTAGLRMKDTVTPNRRDKLAHDYITELNEYFDRLDNRTGTFREKAIGAIINDSITGLTDIFEDFVFSTRQREIGEEGPKAISFNDWRLLAEKVMEAYKSCKSLPCYSVFTAHVETRQQIIPGVPAQGGRAGIEPIATHKVYDVPLVTGQLRDRIAKDFGVVLYTTPDYKWRTRPSEQLRSAGSRGRYELPPEVGQDFAEVLDVG